AYSLSSNHAIYLVVMATIIITLLDLALAAAALFGASWLMIDPDITLENRFLTFYCIWPASVWLLVIGAITRQGAQSIPQHGSTADRIVQTIWLHGDYWISLRVVLIAPIIWTNPDLPAVAHWIHNSLALALGVWLAGMPIIMGKVASSAKNGPPVRPIFIDVPRDLERLSKAV
ncbi:MAG: hypothetical protein ACR2QF_02545, partial [Geminicoccaceae bacterium]